MSEKTTVFCVYMKINIFLFFLFLFLCEKNKYWHWTASLWSILFVISKLCQQILIHNEAPFGTVRNGWCWYKSICRTTPTQTTRTCNATIYVLIYLTYLAYPKFPTRHWCVARLQIIHTTLTHNDNFLFCAETHFVYG